MLSQAPARPSRTLRTRSASASLASVVVGTESLPTARDYRRNLRESKTRFPCAVPRFFSPERGICGGSSEHSSVRYGTSQGEAEPPFRLVLAESLSPLE